MAILSKSRAMYERMHEACQTLASRLRVYLICAVGSTGGCGRAKVGLAVGAPIERLVRVCGRHGNCYA